MLKLSVPQAINIKIISINFHVQELERIAETPTNLEKKLERQEKFAAAIKKKWQA